MSLKIVLLVFFVAINESTGLRCYICGFSSSDSDQSCLTITNSSLTVDCTYKYCTTFRQEYIDPIGVVASFLRGCVDTPDYLNHDIVDSTFRTYYRACTTDFCNIGDGIQSVVGGSLSPTPMYTGSNLLVPGTGVAPHLQISLSLLMSGVILSVI